VIEVTLEEKGVVKTRVLPLKPLRQVRVVEGLLEDVLNQAGTDYTSVVLTDPEDLEVFDVNDRLHYAFPNLLNIRRKTRSEQSVRRSAEARQIPDAYELCLSFLGETDEAQQELLKEIIHQVSEVQL
jgi:exonuclease SbcD